MDPKEGKGRSCDHSLCLGKCVDMNTINHGHNLVNSNFTPLWVKKTGLETYRRAWLNKLIDANWRLTLQDLT